MQVTKKESIPVKYHHNFMVIPVAKPNELRYVLTGAWLLMDDNAKWATGVKLKAKFLDIS